jgi:hypothetical protein
MQIPPLRIAVHQLNEARSLIAAGHTKRARRKLRQARRKVADCNDELLRIAYWLIGEAIESLIDHDEARATDKVRGAVECLIGVMS